MASRSTTAAVMVTTAVGAALWLAAAIASGKREAWDGSLYWTVAYPLAIGSCAALGYVFPERPWRWALLLFQAQFVALCIRNGEWGNLWPMGMLLFAVVAVPGIVAGTIAAWFSRRRADHAL